MGFRIVTQPTIEPITLEEAKAYCRVTDDADDELIQSLISAARQHVESKLRRQIMPTACEYTTDRFPSFASQEGVEAYYLNNAIRLPHPPLQSVTAIKYVDSAGVEQTLSSSTYTVDTTVEPGLVTLKHNNVWPVCRAQQKAVTITYVAGYGTGLETTDAAKRAAVPPAVRIAIKMILRHWYDYRGVQDEVSLYGVSETLDAVLSGQSYGSYCE